MGHANCTSAARLDGKTVVVTGCNTGIGRECVREFYLRGARIIMACRDMGKAREARSQVLEECKGQRDVGSIHLVRLDLSSLQSVRACARRISSAEAKVDVLLNNAGVMMCPPQHTADGLELHMATNHFGHFLLTLLLLPRLIASDSRPARIVNVSSLAHFVSSLQFDDLHWTTRRYNSLLAYGTSKLANVLFAKELARRLQEAGCTHVHTYALHPGVINTELFRHFDRILFKGCSRLANGFLNLFCKTPRQGAQTSIYCALSECCAADTGEYYSECSKSFSSPTARNRECARRLWEQSLIATGLGADFNLMRSDVGVGHQ